MKTGTSKKPVRVHFINNDSVVLVLDVKATVQQLFDQVTSLLSIKETRFFGLSTIVDNEKWFMDLKHKISRYAPKEWGKEIKRRASDVAVTSAAVLTVQFQVQFYVEHPKLISDKVSRHWYYLQIKKNVLRSKVLTQDEVLITLASHAMQSDLGDHNPAGAQDYFRPENYFPSWFIDKWGRDYLISHVPSLHAERAGWTAFESEAVYIQQASGIDDVPVHYYKLFKNKKETKPNVLIGIFHQGIRIHYGNSEKPAAPWKLEFEFVWNKVGRLFFSSKRFEIYPEDLPACRRLTFYTGSHARSKYLLHFLRETHALYMSLQPYAQHMRRADSRRTKRRYRESYISGEDLNLETNDQRVRVSQRGNAKGEKDGENAFESCYQSKTSHGSSHTSGIESDSKQRTEEEEDGVDRCVEGFDLAEVGRRREFVNVTEDHLSGPPPKSLSVTNLADPETAEGAAREFSFGAEGAQSRDSTLTGEDLRIPFALPQTSDKSAELEATKNSSASSEDRDDTLKNGVSLETLTSATMRVSAASQKREAPETDDVGQARRNRKQVRSLLETRTQTVVPQNPSLGGASRLYYDDFQTVPRKPRARSRTEEPPNPAEPRFAAGPEHSNRDHARCLEKNGGKRSSSAHVTARKHFSAPKTRTYAESFNNWKPASNIATRTHSLDQAAPAFSIDSEKSLAPSDATSNLRHFQGSADLASHGSRSSAFVTVARPGKIPEAPVRNDFYTAPRGYDKFVYYDDVLLAAACIGDLRESRKKKASSVKREKRRSRCERFRSAECSFDDRDRLSSFEDENFSQKMSEACARTLSAQRERRKLSDSKFSQRMDSGRGSLRTTTDDSSGCFDVTPPARDATPEFFHAPRNPRRYAVVRAPFYVEDCHEVIV